MRGDLNRHGMRGGPRKKEEGLAESGRVLTSRSDPIGLSQAEAFGNSLADSVSFRFPSRLSLGGSPLLRRWRNPRCQAPGAIMIRVALALGQGTSQRIDCEAIGG